MSAGGLQYEDDFDDDYDGPPIFRSGSLPHRQRSYSLQPTDSLQPAQPTQLSPLNDNNGWNDSIEYDAKVIAEKSGGLRWMHNQSSTVFRLRYWILTGINILLSAIVVAFNAITGASCLSNSFNPYKIVSIVGATLLGITNTYGGIKNYGSRVTAHQVIEGNFQALFYTIKNQLNLNRRDRQFGKDFLEWVQKEYTDLSTNPDSPSIPGFIEEKYKNIIDGVDIASHMDPIEPIVIKQESPPRKVQPEPFTMNHNPRTHSHNLRRRTNRKPSRKRPHSYKLPEEEEDNFTVSIPNTDTSLSAKDKWQLSRFYGNK